MIGLFLDIKNLFVLSVIKAAILKSDLRLYKYEKKVASKGNGLDDEEAKKSGLHIFGFILPFCENAKEKDEDELADNGFLRRLLNDGSTENFVLKSIFGFLGGTILTYICYLFLIYSLNFTLKRATLICMGLGITLSLGLAFSDRIRCTVLLCIPQLFSKRGRQALLAYAFILALSGPAKNTLHNVEVMSESLACEQEQLKKAENELMKCVRSPNMAAKQSLEKMLIKLDFAVKEYQTFVEKFYQLCFAVTETIIHTQEWLYSIYFLCNQKMGSPYSRCTDLLFEASQNCKSISTEPGWINACDVANVQDEICMSGDAPICSVEDLPPLWPFINHRNQLNNFVREAINWIYVKIESHRVFMPPNRTATLHEEYQGMATEIRQKTDQFLQYFDLMSVIFGIFIIVLFIKVIIYRYKFLTEDEYDNRFITSDFVDIDRTRAEFRMQTLLPLELREQKKYIKVSSMQLLPYEKDRLFSSFIFLIIATFKIIIHIFTDSSLYWMLSTMRRHGRMLLQSNNIDQSQVAVVIEGNGIFAQLLRNVTKVVKPYAIKQNLDPVPCLPDPISPDWNRYCQILTLLIICWILALCEPYGLRLRHIVMVTYHPDRARERAIWLYNRILKTRTNFVKYARRQLRKKYKDLDENAFYKTTFLKRKRYLRCLLCKNFLKPNEYYKCPTIGCVGLYCNPCFDALQLCSICKNPSYYGDYSDISEEKDSEEEEEKEEVHCSKCGLFSRYRIYQRPFTEANLIYRSFEMRHPSFKYHKNVPRYEISMDTIVDFNGDDSSGSEDSSRIETGMTNDLPTESPSTFARLMNYCKKTLRIENEKKEKLDGRILNNCEKDWNIGGGRKKERFRSPFFDSNPGESSKVENTLKISTNKLKSLEHSKMRKEKCVTGIEASCKTGKSNDSESKLKCAAKRSEKSPRTTGKQSLTNRTLKSLKRFKWKLKEKIGNDPRCRKGEKRLLEEFKKFTQTAKHVENATNHVYYSGIDHEKKIVFQDEKHSLLHRSMCDGAIYKKHCTIQKRKNNNDNSNWMEAFHSENCGGSHVGEFNGSSGRKLSTLHSKRVFIEKSENRRHHEMLKNVNFDAGKNKKYNLKEPPPFSEKYPSRRYVTAYDSTTAREIRRGSRQSEAANPNIREPFHRQHKSGINDDDEYGNFPKFYKNPSPFEISKLNPKAQNCFRKGSHFFPSSWEPLQPPCSRDHQQGDLMERGLQTRHFEYSSWFPSVGNEKSVLKTTSTFADSFPTSVHQISCGNSISKNDTRSSSPPSSTSASSGYGAIRKQLIDAKRRRQNNCVRMKFKRRISAAKKKKSERCHARCDTTSDSSAKEHRSKSKKEKYGIPRFSSMRNEARAEVTNSAQKVTSKRINIIKAKLTKFFRGRIKRFSISSDDGGHTETRNDDEISHLSSVEFKMQNRYWHDKKSETINQKLGRTPLAPDLLSDLPSSIAAELTSKESVAATLRCNGDSEFECDDNRFQ